MGRFSVKKNQKVVVYKFNNKLVRLLEAKRRVEAKYIFKVIQFNC